MLKRSPEFKKIVPTIAILFMRGDGAVAQTTIQPQQLPQTSAPYSIDPASAIAILLSSGVAVFAIAPKLLEKWFGGAIEARQNKNDLHTLIVKSQAELELDEKRKELESANELADFYLESAREGRKSEKELLMLFVTKELDRAAQASEDLGGFLENYKQIIIRVNAIDKHCHSIDSSLKDIFAVLEMRSRKKSE